MTASPVRAAALRLAVLAPAAAAALVFAPAPAPAPAAVQCAGAGGRWGDVNDDTTVNILDAQQIARASVGLSVANAAAVAARGDVTADGRVDILDAQQIARFSVALSAAARINTLRAGPAAASVTLTPGAPPPLAVGATVTLAAVPRDSTGGDLSACAPVTWASSAPAVATVSAAGVVTGVAAGTATITARSGTATATLAVTVTGAVPGPTGVTVTAVAPGPTSRFYVRIDSGGLATEVIQRVVTTSRTLTQLIPLPAGSGYRVRVYAVDSAAHSPDAEPLVGALGVVRNVAVTTGMTTTAPVALTAPRVTFTMPDSVTVAERAFGLLTVHMNGSAFSSEFRSHVCWLRWGNAALTDLAPASDLVVGTAIFSDTDVQCPLHLPAQGVAGTLTYQANLQFSFYLDADARWIRPQVAFPSTQRGETPRRLQVRPLATGVAVAYTSTRAARRVFVIARGGALAAPGTPEVVVQKDATGRRSDTLTVPLPPGSGYDLRVVSVDSVSWANDSSFYPGWQMAGGGRVTGVTVPSAGTVTVPVALVPPVVTFTLPDSVGVGEPIAGTFTVTDPADLFAGGGQELRTWYDTKAWDRNGPQVASVTGVPLTGAPTGSRSWSITIPARSAPAQLYLQGRAVSYVESPTGGSRLPFSAYDRDVARREPLRAVRVGVPAGGTCATAPIAIGDSVAGALSNVDCVHPVLETVEDRYALTVTERTPVELRLRSAAFDAVVEVRTPDVRLVAANDDDSLSTDALLRVTLDPGSYVISARSQPRSTPTGAYTLTLRRQPRRGTVAYATAGGGSIAMLEPGATVGTTVAVRDTTGAAITPPVSYAVRDDSVAQVLPGEIRARGRSGVTPGTFVVAQAPSLTPVVAESIWVLVPRTATGPVLRTDLASYQLPLTPGAPVTFTVLADLRNAAQLGATDFDLVYPTTLFYGVDAGGWAPAVAPAAGVTVLSRSLTPNIGRISFSYARPGGGTANDGVVPMGQVTLFSRGNTARYPEGTLTLIPGSMVSSSLVDLLPQLTTYHYPLVLRIP